MKLKRNRRHVVILTSILALLMLVGCSSAKTEEVKEEPVPTVQTEVNEIESVTKVEIESVTENVEETEVTKEEKLSAETIAQWARLFDAQEPVLTVWNDIAKEGYVLENGQEYVLKKGDTLTICTKEEKSDFMCQPHVETKIYGTPRYLAIEFDNGVKEKTLYEVSITVAGEEYVFNITLDSDNTSNELVQNTLGMDWVNSLEFDEPTLVVWNDATGNQKIIDDGGTYTIQQGDIVAVYRPFGYVSMYPTPLEYNDGYMPIGKVDAINFIYPEKSETFNMEIEFYKEDEEIFIKKSYIITTP